MARSSIDRRSFFTAMGWPSGGIHDPATHSGSLPRAVISEACLAQAGIICMSCRDACPEQAIRFLPRLGGAFLPEVTTATCTGCGACLPPCPAGAISLAVQPAGGADG